MKTKQMDDATNFFISGYDTDFFETLKGIANLHSFGLSKPKSKVKANISSGVERKITGDLDINVADSGNVWYWSCKYPNYV